MKNWRETVVDILRQLNGEAHLDEIYKKIEPLITDESHWEEGARRTLEVNSADSQAWNKKHDLFKNVEKGSGRWSLKTNFYKKEIFDLNTKFFFLTTGKFEHRDINYEIYTWNKNKNNKLKVGDLFIYRVPQKSSSNKKFYFFGAGQIGEIFSPSKGDPQYQRDGDLCAKIINSIHFENRIYENDLIPSDLGSERKNWGHFFDQYGIDEVSLGKFLFLLNKGTGRNFYFEEESNEIRKKIHQKVLNKDYFVPDSEVKTRSSRGQYQKIFRDEVILPNYQSKCAITGIKTNSLLTAAHIMSWADHQKKRLDPMNGICLSKLVDKCFEDYLIFINEEYRVILSEEVKKDNNLFKELKKYDGKKISLPPHKDYYPNKEYLKLHMERKNKKKKRNAISDCLESEPD